MHKKTKNKRCYQKKPEKEPDSLPLIINTKTPDGK